MAILWGGHHFLRLQTNFRKQQRKMCNRTIFVLIYHRTQGGLIDFIPLPDLYIFIAVSDDTHIDAI